MLEIFNLFVIEKIFEDVKVSSMSKMVYINCLIHHFRDKKPTVSNAVAFEILDTEFDFEKFKRNIHELHKVGLVSLSKSVIIFNNVWGNLIDKTKLDKVLPEHYLGAINFYPAKNFEKSMSENRSLLELCAMKYKLSKEQTTELLKVFIKEQTTFEKTYQTESECLRHATAWIGKNKDKAGAKVIVKSSARNLT